MELLYTVLLFVLLAGGTAVLGVKLWARPRAAIERVTGQLAAPVEKMPVHPSLVFRDMVARLGATLPVGAKGTGRLERRLIRAGYRRPQTVRVVYGAKLLLGVALPLLAWALVSRFAWAVDTQIMIVAGAAILGYSAPGYFVTFKARRRQRRIRRGLPDALDLLVICVESGLGLDQAIMQAAKELELAQPDISREFAMVNHELRTGTRRADALRNLAARTAVVHALRVRSRPRRCPGKPARREHVQGRDRLDQDAGMAVDHAGHQRAQPGRLGESGQVGKRAVALQHFIFRGAENQERSRPPIWKKWSMTQMLEKPASSAVRAISASLPPSSLGPAGKVKFGICSPIFMVIYLLQEGVAWLSISTETLFLCSKRTFYSICVR